MSQKLSDSLSVDVESLSDVSVPASAPLNSEEIVCSECRGWINEVKFFENLGVQDILPAEIPRPCFYQCLTTAIEEQLDDSKQMQEGYTPNESATLLLDTAAALKRVLAMDHPGPIDDQPSLSMSRALSLASKNMRLNPNTYQLIEKFLIEHELFPDDEEADQSGIGELESVLEQFGNLE